MSTYSVLSFIYSLANAILSGVAQGLQPLWGNSYGKQDTAEIHFYFRCGNVINFSLSVLIFAILTFFDKEAIRIFNQDRGLITIAAKALPVFALSFIPMSLNLIFTSFLYSTKRTKQSDIIAICRGIVIKGIAIFSIPIISGSTVIWTAPLVAETLTLILAVFLVKNTKLVYK